MTKTTTSYWNWPDIKETALDDFLEWIAEVRAGMTPEEVASASIEAETEYHGTAINICIKASRPETAEETAAREAEEAIAARRNAEGRAHAAIQRIQQSRRELIELAWKHAGIVKSTDGMF